MTLAGHDEPWREWRAAMASGRMHHAWILAGPRGVGKGHFARAAAAMLVAEPGVAQPAPGAHPDILLLEPLPDGDEEARKRDEGGPYRRKRNITVDQIRAMQQRLVTRATLGSRRAIVVDPADDMEKSAVNALLKSLEEPPVGTFFLLVAHRPGRLLATVRSRCRFVRFPALEDEAIAEVLCSAVPEAAAPARAAAAVAARGSPGAALAFLRLDLAPIDALLRRIAESGDADLTLRAALAEAVGPRPDRERLLATLDLAMAVLADGIEGGPRERQLRIVEAHAAIVALAVQAPTFNFDPGLLMMEIGGLLASAPMPRESAR